MATAAGKADKSANGPKAEQASASEMEAHIEILKAEIAKLKAQIQSSGETSLEAIRGIAHEGAGRFRAQGEAAMSDLKLTARDFEHEVAAAVRDKPMTSLAIAAGVGFIFALLARR